MHVLITGPASARPFLDAVAATLGDEAAQIHRRVGLTTPTDYENWADTEVLVTFGVPCGDADMASAPRLSAIVVPSLGYEGIDVDAATTRGIAVANGHVVENFESVAEAAVLFMLAMLYDLHGAEQRLRDGRMRSGPPLARMLKGCTIGLLGFGNIARAVVARLGGWGVRILVSSRRAVVTDSETLQNCDVATLLRESDVVLPLLPLTDETYHLLARQQLLAMKKGAILINLSRGAVIDEAALDDPEVIAHLGGIALDVFETEPLPTASALRQFPKAILTGHEISHTRENLQALFDTAVGNVRAAIRGDRLPTLLNGVVGSRSPAPEGVVDE